jgi:hypothetical protein
VCVVFKEFPHFYRFSPQATHLTSFVAYSIAARGSWIEHGPTTAICSTARYSSLSEWLLYWNGAFLHSPVYYPFRAVFLQQTALLGPRHPD